METQHRGHHLTAAEWLNVMVALILSNNWTAAAKSGPPEDFAKAFHMAEPDMKFSHYAALHAELTKVQQPESQTIKEDLEAAAALREGAVRLPASGHKAKPTEKKSNGAHWTQRPENKAKVVAMSKKSAKTRAKEARK